MDHDNAKSTLNPTSLPVADAARLLAHASGQAVTAAMIEADLAAGSGQRRRYDQLGSLRRLVG